VEVLRPSPGPSGHVRDDVGTAEEVFKYVYGPCFTDWSRLEYTGRTGASVFVESHNFKQVVQLGNYATVFQAKVYEPALGFSTIAVRSKVQQWAHNEHNKHWFNTEGCRQAEELVTQVTPGLSQFALRQCRRDLRTLVYLLTGHNTLS